MERLAEPSDTEDETDVKQLQSDNNETAVQKAFYQPEICQTDPLQSCSPKEDATDSCRVPNTGQKAAAAATEMSEWTKDDVCRFMRQCGINKPGVEAKIHEQEIDGEVLQDLTMDHLKEVFGEQLVFGERMKILKKRNIQSGPGPVTADLRDANQMLVTMSKAQASEGVGDVRSKCLPDEEKAESSKNKGLTRTAILRPFDKDVDLLFKYNFGAFVSSAINRPGDLMVPVHHFVELDLSQKNGLHRLSTELVKFACACLNERTNGTIHFGVSPAESETDPRSRITGTTLTKDESAYSIFLDRALEECFLPDQRDIVRGCVRPPKFVEVLKDADDKKRFVVEVDVVPVSILCGDHAFYAKLPSHKEAGVLQYDSPQVYRLVHGNSKPIEGDELRLFMKMAATLFSQRRDKEHPRHIPRFRRDLKQKLVNLLCQGEEGFVGDIYPILVINRPASHMNKEYLNKNLSFLECIPWKVVFDFDSTAQVCQFMDKDREQVTKIIHNCSEFDSKSKANLHNSDRLKSLQEDIRCSLQQPWVFANGYDLMESESEMRMNPRDWKKVRREGFKEAVRFFGNEIPAGRAVVVFCLLSSDWEVMLEGSEDFLSTFPDQWMCIAEDDFVSKPWMEELLRRNCVDEDTLEANVVSGMPWSHVQDTVQNLQGQRLPDECTLVRSDGTVCVLTKKAKNELADLEILGSSECEMQVNSNNTENLEDLCKAAEKDFYQGQEAKWLNFWSQNHVCKRSQFNELYKNVTQALNGDLPDDDRVGRVLLYHQPGAGGTTLAKHVLWELRKQYRCATVGNLSDQTAEQIMTFRSYGDKSDPKPVLLLLDNNDEEKTNLLAASLEKRSKRITREIGDTTKVICVMLVCLRRSKLPKKFAYGCLLLKHELQADEQSWFHRKAKELDQNFNKQIGADPKVLLSFNILKENFDLKYVDRTVKALVKEMDNDKEKQLLKYVAMLNSYDVQFRPVPTSAFDFVMFEMSLNQQKKGMGITYGIVGSHHQRQRRWETKLSSPFRVLTNETTKTALGHIHSLRIANPLLSKGILDALRNVDDQSISDVALSFLRNTEILNVPTGLAKVELLKIITDVLKTRRRHLSGRPETQFPPIIQEVIDKESVEQAKTLLIKGYEVMKDPFIAQQITRVLIHIQKWDEALTYARLATDQKPDNSYLWDTYGRVFQRQLTDQLRSLIDENTILTMGEAIALTAQATKGIQKFRMVQSVSEQEEKIANNDAGYFGELETVVHLLDCLSFLDIFKRDRQKLHQFLVDPSFIPAEISKLDSADCHTFVEEMKALHENVKRALNRLEDERMQLREEVLDHYRKSHYSLSNEKLANLRVNLASYFGEDSDIVPDDLGQDPGMQCAYRQRRIFRLAGYTLKSIFDLREEAAGEAKLRNIRKLAVENIASDYPRAEDYQTAICASFALILVREKYAYEPLRKEPPRPWVKYEEMVSWSDSLYKLRDKHVVVSLEPYMFYTMFNWPRKDSPPNSHVTPNVLIDVLRCWKEAYYVKYPRQREDGKPYRKKDTTMFFLANGSGIHSIATYEELRDESNLPQKSMRSDAFWAEPHVLRKLKRFKGLLLTDGGEVRLQLEYDGKYQSPIQIPTSFPIRQRAYWNKTVYFVIGFSWFGPKAFDVQPKDPTEDSEFMTIGHRVPGQPADSNPRPRTPMYTAQSGQARTTHIQFLETLKQIDTRLGQLATIQRDLSPQQKVRAEREEQRLKRTRKELILERQRSLLWWSD